MCTERGEIKITETEEGFHVEVKGKNFKEMFSRCCRIPVVVTRGDNAATCCPPEDCCPPGKNKKE